MSVVGWRRILEGTELTGKVGESLRITEKWEVRTDSPATPKLQILGAVPVGWNSSHWEFSDCKAQEFTLSPNNRTGMVWTLTATFYLPPKNKKLDANGKPEDYWEANGGTTTVPAFKDINGDTIVNSAKDPLEGIEREREEESWTLTKYYTTDDWKTDRDAFAGKVNSDGWAGGEAKTWKCYFKGAKRLEIQDVDINAPADGAAVGAGGGGGNAQKRTLVETTWEFRKEPDTWKCKPWDIGFMELVAGKRQVIRDDKGNAVKQPVALNSNGTKKSPGQAPSVIKDGAGVDLYQSAAFAGKFGDPHIVPAA